MLLGYHSRDADSSWKYRSRNQGELGAGDVNLEVIGVYVV